MKLAFIVQRYGLEVCGGAELHCRLLAEHLSKYFEVEVLTTCAKDYLTWKNEYKKGTEKINGVAVHRFKNDKERNMNEFSKLSGKIFNKPHGLSEELDWMKMQGPYCPELIQFIKKNNNKYNFIVFFSYLYFLTYFGIRIAPEKSLLIPMADDSLPLTYLELFKDIFSLPKAIIYNVKEERNNVNIKFNNSNILSDTIGVGVDIPKDIKSDRFRNKYGIDGEFILYIGRIEECKGCLELFDHFIRYKNETKSNLKLVLMGKPTMKIPEHKDIIPLGFISEKDKFDGLDASALLILPSYYESLSMAVLEAFSIQKPVLVNGKCKVLKAHCLDSNAGLCYENYDEFKGTLDLLLSDKILRREMGLNGKKYFNANYTWDAVEKKYLNLFERLSK